MAYYWLKIEQSGKEFPVLGEAPRNFQLEAIRQMLRQPHLSTGGHGGYNFAGAAGNLAIYGKEGRIRAFRLDRDDPQQLLRKSVGAPARRLSFSCIMAGLEASHPNSVLGYTDNEEAILSSAGKENFLRLAQQLGWSGYRFFEASTDHLSPGLRRLDDRLRQQTLDTIARAVEALPPESRLHFAEKLDRLLGERPPQGLEASQPIHLILEPAIEHSMMLPELRQVVSRYLLEENIPLASGSALGNDMVDATLYRYLYGRMNAFFASDSYVRQACIVEASTTQAILLIVDRERKQVELVGRLPLNGHPQQVGSMFMRYDLGDSNQQKAVRHFQQLLEAIPPQVCRQVISEAVAQVADRHVPGFFARLHTPGHLSTNRILVKAHALPRLLRGLGMLELSGVQLKSAPLVVVTNPLVEAATLVRANLLDREALVSRLGLHQEQTMAL